MEEYQDNLFLRPHCHTALLALMLECIGALLLSQAQLQGAVYGTNPLP